MKIELQPNTTLYPVPVVLVTCKEKQVENILTVNRIASVNAEPPMLAIAIRPGRASHAMIRNSGEFGVNIPWPEMEIITDFIGSTTQHKTDKWTLSGLTRQAASTIKTPLILECPVNLECIVREEIKLPSHSLFIGEVVAMHAEQQVLNEKNEVDFELGKGGMPYLTSVVRERPVQNIKPDVLAQKIKDRKK